MDGSFYAQAPALDISSVAGRITAILAERYDQAASGADPESAERFNVGVDTIYFASLLLMVVNGSGHTRGRAELLLALDTAQDVIGELRLWLEGHVAPPQAPADPAPGLGDRSRIG